jgi:beta-N-acetylhexosaminidase
MVLICNHPERADQLLAELQSKTDKASQRRIRKLFARRKPMDWNKLEQEPEYRASLRTLKELALIG